MLQHFFAEKILFMRGCGWSRKKNVAWSEDDMKWIVMMDGLFSKIFGDDFLVYQWNKVQRSVCIAPDSFPCYTYDHALWEEALQAAEPSELNFQAKCPPSGVTSFTAPTSPPNDNPQPVSSASKVSAPPPGKSKDSNTPMCTSTPKPSYLADLRACASSNSTRGQLATLNLPPVVQIADGNIQLVNNAERVNNPLQQSVRPSESALKKGCELMKRAGGEVDDSRDPYSQSSGRPRRPKHRTDDQNNLNTRPLDE
ncbi:hypothetical protein OS493_012961 [Desmophyllum pertusum]|uniref:Uncharacterized protein n=1 Tax=Desmophyllum pertusum TaxID=174260 RepID=A0A9W9Z2Y6_9CNID|nr:hypothetical protein OS493_012961 [Desmophyllum pertusum]